VVTNIFPDGKISRLSAETLAKVEPQLGIFASRLRREQKYACAFKKL